MQLKHKIISASFIVAMFVASPLSQAQAKPAVKMPEAFGSGMWVAGVSAQSEKNICKKKQIEFDEDFIITFSPKTNSYKVSGWEYTSQAKILSLSAASPTALKGKAKFTGTSIEGTTTETAAFDFSIKNDRLYSKYFGGRAKQSGLYHCK